MGTLLGEPVLLQFLLEPFNLLPGHQLVVPLEGLFLQFLDFPLALFPDFACNLLLLGQPESVQFKKNLLNAGLVEGVIFLLNL